jgi:hypothetical protein
VTLENERKVDSEYCVYYLQSDDYKDLHSPGTSRSLDACYDIAWHTCIHPHGFRTPAVCLAL